jgi:hypothetical protein
MSTRRCCSARRTSSRSHSDGDPADVDAAAIKGERGTTATKRRDNAAPIRICAVHRCLDQWRRSDRARSLARLRVVCSAAYIDVEPALCTLSVRDELLGQ